MGSILGILVLADCGGPVGPADLAVPGGEMLDASAQSTTDANKADANDASGVDANAGSDMAVAQAKLSMPVELSTTVQIWQLGVGDFDNDGRLDVVAGGSANLSVIKGVFVTFNNGARSFAAPSMIAPIGGESIDDPRISPGDFNNDGRLDFAFGATMGGSQQIFTVQSLGKRKFAAPQEVPYAFQPGQPLESFTTSDLDHDGNPDLIMSGPGVMIVQGQPPPPTESRVLVQYGNGKGGFGAPVGFAADSPQWVAAADLDLDGWADVVTAPFAPGHVLFNDKGRLLAPSNPFGDIITLVAVGDMNGDGFPDIVALGNPGGINVTLSAGKRAFGITKPYHSAPTSDFALGDINHDGRLDVVGADGAGGYYLTLGLAGGGLADPVPLLKGTGGDRLAIADLDGDKKDDLIISDGKNIAIYFNDSP